MEYLYTYLNFKRFETQSNSSKIPPEYPTICPEAFRLVAELGGNWKIDLILNDTFKFLFLISKFSSGKLFCRFFVVEKFTYIFLFTDKTKSELIVITSPIVALKVRPWRKLKAMVWHTGKRQRVKSLTVRSMVDNPSRVPIPYQTSFIYTNS